MDLEQEAPQADPLDVIVYDHHQQSDQDITKGDITGKTLTNYVFTCTYVHCM